MIKIENWAVVSGDDAFTPPELSRIYLTGEVYGHSKFPDGDSITSSSIKSVSGRKVTTYSGTEYLLGEPCSDYVKWVVETTGKGIDEAEPIKMRRV